MDIVGLREYLTAIKKNMSKALFILFFSANLCCADYIKEPELPLSNDSSSKVIWLGLVGLVAYTIIPNLLKELEKSETNQLTTGAEAEKASIESDTIVAPEKKETEKSVTRANKWKRMLVLSLYAASLVASAYIIYTAANEMVSMGKDLYNYLYPSAEMIARRKEARKTLATLHAESEFIHCLIRNAKGLRNQDGIPISCEECGQVFGLTAGIDAYHDMVKLFKETYSKYSYYSIAG